ncbi:hypothetical protein [Mariniflexile sp. AS56]|uniref:hypothetical protein n=1 Tax=Mariniflexile sp. AS56 TaxID=3063957 RepID=UPI00398B485F
MPKKTGKIDRYGPLRIFLIRRLKTYIKIENSQIYLFNLQVTKDGETQGLTTNGIGWIIRETAVK